MPINQYLNSNSLTTEKDLIDSLKQESIQQKGVDVHYVLRDMENQDYLFGESPMSQFEKSAVIEMYFARMESFAGDADLFSKFGVESSDTATFQVSCKRFVDELGQFDIDRPREGDLIYVEISNALFEIKNVIIEQKYYQIGRNYTWSLNCKLFQYSQEIIETGVTQVDAFNTLNSVEIDDTDEGIMRRVLGITDNNEETEEIRSEIGKSILASSEPDFNPDDPFGEG